MASDHDEAEPVVPSDMLGFVHDDAQIDVANVTERGRYNAQLKARGYDENVASFFWRFFPLAHFRALYASMATKQQDLPQRYYNFVENSLI